MLQAEGPQARRHTGNHEGARSEDNTKYSISSRGRNGSLAIRSIDNISSWQINEDILISRGG